MWRFVDPRGRSLSVASRRIWRGRKHRSPKAFEHPFASRGLDHRFRGSGGNQLPAGCGNNDSGVLKRGNDLVRVRIAAADRPVAISRIIATGRTLLACRAIPRSLWRHDSTSCSGRIWTFVISNGGLVPMLHFNVFPQFLPGLQRLSRKQPCSGARCALEHFAGRRKVL